MSEYSKDKYGKTILPTAQEEATLIRKEQAIVKADRGEIPRLNGRTNRAFLDDDRVDKIVELVKLGLPEDIIEDTIPGMKREAIHTWKMIALNLHYSQTGRSRSQQVMKRLPVKEQRLVEVVKKIKDARHQYIKAVGTARRALLLGVPNTEGKIEKAPSDARVVESALNEITGGHARESKAPVVNITQVNQAKVNTAYSDENIYEATEENNE